MQLQFNKTVIPCLHTVKRELQTQEQTQEVRLTDDMPDIGKVLAGWGQLVIRGKEWRTGSVGVSGGIMVWVLYAPEDGGDVQCVETWLPFQVKWDIPDTQRDGSIHAIPYLRGVDARSLSARKLMVRAGVGILGEIFVPDQVEVFSPEEVPEDVQVLRRSYPVLIPMEAGEKAFTMEETLTLPSTEPAIRKLIRYDMQPKVMESRVIGDKLVIRGVARLSILYMAEDNRLHKWDFELPFSQYAELDREYGADAEAAIHMAVTALELDMPEENLLLKAGLTAQYVIWGRTMVETVADMYSPHRQMEINRTQLQMPALLNGWTESMPVEHKAETDGMQILDSVFYPDQPQLRQENGSAVAELSGVFQLLGYNPEGVPQSVVSRWEAERKIDSADDVRVELTAQMAGNELIMGVHTFASDGIPMVMSAEAAQEPVQDPDRPSLVLRRVGKESLWDIAKQTGSTVEAIKKANALQQEPDEGQMLLIPVS